MNRIETCTAIVFAVAVCLHLGACGDSPILSKEQMPSYDKSGSYDNSDTLERKQPASDSVHVISIYPTAHVIPENSLRFHIRFSGAMGRNNPHRFIHLLDANNVEVNQAFVDLPEPMWNSSRTVLTMILHPGRVKSGLKAHIAEGRALRLGHTCSVRVDAGMIDAEGQPLAQSRTQTYRVGPAAKTPIDIETWIVHPAPCGSTDPITVHIRRPLDALSAGAFLRVLNAKQVVVQGQIKLASSEEGWLFTPKSPWPSGLLYVRIDRRLEDCAGNTMACAFDSPPSHNDANPNAPNPSAFLLLPFRATN